MVHDFYDKMRVDEDTRLIHVTYGNNVHIISIEVIVAPIRGQPQYTTEKNPKAS